MVDLFLPIWYIFGMNILTLIQTHLAKCKDKDLKALAAKSGVPYHTLLKIKSGETKNPRIFTVLAIFEAVFK